MTYDDGFLMSEDGGANWKMVDAGGHYFLGKLFSIDQPAIEGAGPIRYSASEQERLEQD